MADMTAEESDRIRHGRRHALETANGERFVDEHIRATIPSMALNRDTLALRDCPSLISMGRLVVEDGWEIQRDRQNGCVLTPPDNGAAVRAFVHSFTPQVDLLNMEGVPRSPPTVPCNSRRR